MPTTPPTIVAPLPHDPRVIMLAQATGLTRREAFGAAAEAWEWLAAHAADGLVVKVAPDVLTALVDVAGFGPAMIQAGLVGVVDDGLVLPAELRRLERDQRGGRGATDATDANEKKKAGARRRSKNKYWRDKLNKPASKTSPQPVAEPSGPKRAPYKIGEVAGYPVMVLFRKADGVPFYQLMGATPTQWTGTVTEPDRPSFAEALAAIMHAMKRARDSRKVDSGSMLPTIDTVLSTAERYKENRRAAAADEARRNAANAAFMEASADDQDDAAERETSRQPHDLTRETAKPHGDLTRDAEAPVVTSPSDDSDLGAAAPHAKPHADLTPTAPSSSSVFSVSGIEDIENTTTTSNLTRDADRQRDHEDDILDRMLAVPSRNGGGLTTDTEDDPERREQQQRRQERDARIAKALGLDINIVRIRNEFYLEDQCRRAGIDFKTGYPVNADAPDEPRGARIDTDMTTEPTAGDKPATGVVVAREGGEPDPPEFDVPHRQLRAGLRRQGIPLPTVNAPPDADDAFEHDAVIDAATGAACGPL